MTYEETMQRLKEMESRYNDGFSSLDRSYLDSLYFSLFGREISNKGCSDCYRDAYMEVNIKLKKTKAMPKKSDFVLKAGAIITFFGEAQCYSNANLTDEAALRFLSMNPRNESLFEKLPADWKERAEKYNPNKPTVPEASDKDAIIARLTEENEQLRQENEGLKTSAPRKKTKKKAEAEPSPEPPAEVAEESPTEVERSTEESADAPDEVSIEETEEALAVEE